MPSASFTYSNFDIIAPRAMFHLLRTLYGSILVPSSSVLGPGQREQSEVNAGADAERRLHRRRSFRRAGRLPEKKNDHAIANCRAEFEPTLVRRFLANAAYALLDLMGRRAAIKTLSELDDRALRDIGITRSQIEDAVGGRVKSEMMRYL